MKTERKIIISKRGKIPKIVLILLAVFCFLPFFTNDAYFMHIAVTLAITGALSTNFNLAAGYAGQTSFAHAAYYGIGAYIVGILGTRYGVTLWQCIPIAFIGAIVTGLLVALPTLRLRGTYRVLCTIGFQIIFDTILLRWVSLTNGPIGISSIPIPTFFGLSLQFPQTYYFVAYAWLLINILILWRVESSRLGFALLAIKGDEDAAVASGVAVRNYKLWAFSASAGLAAVTGCIFSAYIRAISPVTFNVDYSPVVLCMALLGGSGTIFGGLVGAIILGLIPEFARVIQDYRMLLYGLLMIVLVLFMPDGILGMLSRVSYRIKEAKSLKGGKGQSVDS